MGESIGLGPTGALPSVTMGFNPSGSPCEPPSSLYPTTLRSAKIPGNRVREDDARCVTLLDHMRSQTFRRESLLPVLRKPSVSLLGPPVYTEVHEKPCRVPASEAILSKNPLEHQTDP